MLGASETGQLPQSFLHHWPAWGAAQRMSKTAWCSNPLLLHTIPLQPSRSLRPLISTAAMAELAHPNILRLPRLDQHTLVRAQVDLVLNYDTNASPIRAVQRSGRTGRSRAGRVVHLLAAGKEERQFRKQLAVRLRNMIVLCAARTCIEGWPYCGSSSRFAARPTSPLLLACMVVQHT